MNPRFVLSVDPSLTCSGWALFQHRDSALLAVGKIRALPAKQHRMAERLSNLQLQVQKLLDCYQMGQGDVLLCEGPTTMKDPRAALVVEQVRGIFESCARERRVRVPGRVNPRTIHAEVIGFRGKQRPREEVKLAAREIVSRLFSKSLAQIGFKESKDSLHRHQDIVDALLIGHYSLSQLRHADRCGRPLEEFFSQNESVRSKTW